MATAAHRQTVTLSAAAARRVKALARERGTSASRVLARLVEQGLESEQNRIERFRTLAEQFRSAQEPAEANRLGHALGRMIFGD